MPQLIARPSLMAFVASSVFAQTFSVATIKPMGPNDGPYVYMGLPGGGLRVEGLTLKSLLMEAYAVEAFQISGGPGWIATDRWDIEAKTEGVQGGLSGAQHASMLLALLEDRFQLKVHRETREGSVYNLVLGKTGSKLTPSTEPKTEIRGGFGVLTYKRIGIASFTVALSRALGRTVIDRTGLTGQYDFKLQWTPDTNQGGPESLGLPPDPNYVPPQPADPNGPSIFTAIQEQLGLRLEPAKGPVEFVVIDSAEKPSAN